MPALLLLTGCKEKRSFTCRVVLVAYNEWTAIPDILLAEHFLKVNDDDLPGDSKHILTAADFDF